jgi:hypothetical protein
MVPSLIHPRRTFRLTYFGVNAERHRGRKAGFAAVAVRAQLESETDFDILRVRLPHAVQPRQTVCIGVFL